MLIKIIRSMLALFCGVLISFSILVLIFLVHYYVLHWGDEPGVGVIYLCGFLVGTTLVFTGKRIFKIWKKPS